VINQVICSSPSHGDILHRVDQQLALHSLVIVGELSLAALAASSELFHPTNWR
jgi:hypothetical protein